MLPSVGATKMMSPTYPNRKNAKHLVPQAVHEQASYFQIVFLTLDLKLKFKEECQNQAVPLLYTNIITLCYAKSYSYYVVMLYCIIRFMKFLEPQTGCSKYRFFIILLSFFYHLGLSFFYHFFIIVFALFYHYVIMALS